ncbi:MAG: isoamylase early set domain-containing protein [Bacteroidales bacterium]|nr:isoamylase early set domain-containing protein [Bacteroidales bacterium]
MEIKKQYLKSSSDCKVTFKVEKEVVNGATEVSIAGDFNGWNPEATPMKIAKSGEASVSINLETGKEFQYKIVLNKTTWINDPSADKTQPNEFGEENSVVII